VNLCKQGGYLYVDAPARPSLYLREGASATNYMRIYSRASGTHFILGYGSAASTMDISPIPGSTDNGIIQSFRNTNTSGIRRWDFYLGDGSGTVQHRFDVGTGDVNLCQVGGELDVRDVINFANGSFAELQLGGSAWAACNSSFTTLGRSGYITLMLGDDVRINVASSAPVDGDLGNGSLIYYLDEGGNNLMVKLKYAAGTVKTGTVCALA
jgi:hypothetical protein